MKAQVSINTGVLVLSLLTFRCYAQLLHPSDMAVGRWKVSLNRKDRSLLESMVFPLSPISSSPERNENEDVSKRIVKENLSATIPRTSRRRRLDCDLILDGDGTFTLMPPSEIQNGDVDGDIENSIRQPLRGFWNLKPNPYCVTDRHYDELKLESLPKVRVSSQDVVSESTRIENNRLEQIRIEMNCNMWGRFGSNTIRHLLKMPRGKDAGRLTHGTMSVVKIESGGLKEKHSRSPSQRRVLFASFTARHH